MKTKLLAIAWSIAVSAGWVASAQAETFAGWDFSQYRGDRLLSIDGSTFTNVLDANYSILDPTHGAGAESAAYGTAYFDGSFGSTSVPADASATLFVPTAGSAGLDCERAPIPPAGCSAPNVDGPISSNRNYMPGFIGYNGFDSLSILRAEGQTFQNLLAMSASDAVSIVFAVDVTAADESGGDWTVSFGGKTFTGGGDAGGEQGCDPDCSATVGIDYSTDGTSYSNYGSVVLTEEDQRFEVALDTAQTNVAFVRLNITPEDGTPMIDNVAINATPLPEPAGTVQLLAGMVGLLALHRLRS